MALKLAGEEWAPWWAEPAGARVDLNGKSIINYPMFLRQRTGIRIASCLLSAPLNTTDTAPGANLLLALPFLVPVKLTLDRLGILVQGAGVAGEKARLGVYADNGNMYPGSLKVDGGEVAIDAIGWKDATISLQLTPGIYWEVLITNSATATFLKLGSGRHLASALIGWDYEQGWSVAQAYGALSDPFPSGAGAARVYHLTYRIASYDD